MVVVAAVRTRSAAATAACPRCIRPGCSAPRSVRVDWTGVDPAAVGQVIGGTVTQVGEQCLQPGPHGLAGRGAAAAGAGHHRRRAVRVLAAGVHAGRRTGRRGHHRRRHGVRRGVHEPDPDRRELRQGPGPGRPVPEGLPAALRVLQPVPSGRADRAAVRHRPGPRRRVRTALPAARGGGVGAGPLRRPGGHRRRWRPKTASRLGWPGTRACGKPARSKLAGAQARDAGRHPHGRHRARRSPTAPARSC